MRVSRVGIKGENVRRLLDYFPDKYKKLVLTPREDVYLLYREFRRYRGYTVGSVVITFDNENSCLVDMVVDRYAESFIVEATKFLRSIWQIKDWKLAEDPTRPRMPCFGE